MRKSRVVLAGAGVAAAVATGTAFTAANTFTQPSAIAGYGQTLVTGATVTDTDFTAYSADPTDLATVVFNTSTNVNGKTATLTLKNGVTGPVIGTFTCDTSSSVYGSGTMDIICDTSATHPKFDAFTYVGLTVLD
jgi:hypothetical protein